MASSVLKRNYIGSDAYMVNQSSIVLGLATPDVKTFTAFDSSIDDKFLDDFKTLIQQAFGVVSDSVAIIPQKNATADVKKAMEKGKDLYENIIYFVTKKAFPGNKTIAKEFGVGKMAIASRSQLKFTLFLETLFQKATIYKTELLAAGCNASYISDLEVAANTLSQANVKQEILKRGRPVLTSDRITLLNKCHAKLSILNAAGQIVYRNVEDKKAQFVFSPAKKTQKVTSYQAPIAPNATEKVFDLPYNSERTLSLRASNATLEFGLSVDGANVIGETVSVAPNNLVIKKSSELSQSGNYLLCINKDTVEGIYDVEADR
jgi:hypothetical protein